MVEMAAQMLCSKSALTCRGNSENISKKFYVAKLVQVVYMLYGFFSILRLSCNGGKK
jgi:hypothetical protein